MMFKHGSYQHLFKLFFLWNNRIEAQKLQQEKNRIESELKAVAGKFIRPLGTE
jgi:hypothetical protein